MPSSSAEWVLKAGAAVVALAIATLAAIYVAGWLFLLTCKADPRRTTLSTYYDYTMHYGDVAEYQKRLRLSGVGAMIVAFGIPGVLLYKALNQPRPLHGAARFATRAEIQEAGLLAEKGVVLGRRGWWRREYLMLDGQQYAILAAPVRSGKGVGIVIPNLLTFADSIVVLDIKHENYKITAGYRSQYQRVYVFNPFAEDRRTHRYNPLGYVRDGLHRVGDLISIGEVFYPSAVGNEKEAFFNDQARNFFVGLGLYLCETPELPRTIGELLRQSSGNGAPIGQYLKTLVDTRAKEGRPLSRECVDSLRRLMNTAENTLTSIVSTFNAPLLIWSNPIVDAATSANDFDLRDVRRERMTIYVATTPDHLEEAPRLMNLFFSQLLKLNTKCLPEHDASLRYQCLLLLDEFTSLGRVGIIAKSLAFMAGYGLRLFPVFQSVSQLAEVYGEYGARTLMTNHAAQVIYAPKEQKDAREFSEALGDETVRAKSTSTQKGGRGGGRSESISEQRRALLLPQELKELGKTKEIILYENCKPIRCEKICYYKDDVFKSRLCEAPEIPELDMETFRARVEGRSRPLTATEAEAAIDLSKLTADMSALPWLGLDAKPHEVEAFVEEFFAKLDEGARAQRAPERTEDEEDIGEEENGGDAALNAVNEDRGDIYAND